MAEIQRLPDEINRRTIWLRCDDGCDDALRAALFGELVKCTHGLTQWYHSDLYHDARWVSRNVTGPMIFWYAARDLGASIGTDRDLVANIVGRGDRLWRVELAQETRSARWTVTFCEVARAQTVA